MGQAETPSSHHKPNEIIAAGCALMAAAGAASPAVREPLSEVLGVSREQRREGQRVALREADAWGVTHQRRCYLRYRSF